MCGVNLKSVCILAVLFVATFGGVASYDVTQTRRDGTRTDSYGNINVNKGLVFWDDLRIDPLVRENPDRIQQLILVFKSMEDVDRFLSRKPRDMEIMATFKIIPAVLVKSTLNTILAHDKVSEFGLKAVFANRVVSMPKYYKVNKLIRAAPTSKDTALLMGADNFWDNGYNGSDVVAAVIDTGVNYSHPELAGKVVNATSFVMKKYGYDYDEPDPMDVEGHGTACAGIIAGRGLDPRGNGVAPGALIMSARIFSKRGGGATWAAIVAAIEWATFGPDGNPNTGDEADVINLSIGGGEIYGSPIWLAMERATEYGVVVCASAGNEGDDQIGSMSIGDPGNAPWCISVGATNAEYTDIDEFYGQYTSIGPTITLAVKPDVAAPSGTLVLWYQGGYTGSTWHGTSFSCPHTVGASALIIDYLKQHGISKEYYPWLVKSLLMETASPLFADVAGERVLYEDLIVGKGIVNLTAAYNELESSSISSSSYPQWVTILPTKVPVGISNSTQKVPEHLPYFPYYDRVFINQTIYFNFTIISSHNTTMSVSFEGNFSTAINVNSPLKFNVTNMTQYWEFNFTVKPDAMEGYYEGFIVFNDAIYGGEYRIPIKFKVVTPTLRILFDLKHTDWSIDYRYGQYRFWVRAFEVLHNASVDMLHHMYKGEVTLDLLSKYDMVIFPDTASAEPIFLNNGTYLGYFYDNFSQSEIDAIKQYVDQGGVILIFALDDEYHNITNINKVIEETEAKLTGKNWSGKDKTIAVDSVGAHMLVKYVPQLPYLGLKMAVSPLSEVLLQCKDSIGLHKLAVVYQGFTGGGIIALGTNFMFDNWAFKARYSGTGDNAVNVYNFTENIYEFALFGKDIIENVTLSGTLMQGETIQVEAYNSTPILNMTCRVVYQYGEYYGGLTYNSSSKKWTGTVNLEQAGDAYIYVYAYILSGDGVHYVVRSQRVYISPSETNVPTPKYVIPSNMSSIQATGDDVWMEMGIGDDTGIIVDAISISSNISGISKMIDMIDDRNVNISVKIPYSQIMVYFAIKKKVSILVTVKVMDVNLNIKTTRVIIHVIGEANPPHIQLVGLLNGSEISIVIQNLTYRFNITDDTGIYNVSDVWVNHTGTYMVNITNVSRKSWQVTITIPWSSINETMIGKKITLVTMVETIDLCQNVERNYYVLYLIPKVEEIPPEIYPLNFENDTIISIKEGETLEISIMVYDSSGIGTLNIYLNIPSDRYSVEIIKNNETWIANITIEWDAVNDLIVDGKLEIEIMVSCTDRNLNQAQRYYVLTIEYEEAEEKKEKTTTEEKVGVSMVALIGVVLAIVVLAVVLLTIKMKKKT